MPRWLPAVLLLLAATLWWVAHRNSAPLAATIGADGAAAACRVLQVPASFDDDALQTAQVAPAFRAGSATLTPLAGFSVAARVLSREDYSSDRAAQYSPTDLALGWGPMSAPGLAEQLEVSQAERWYHYRWDDRGPPLPPLEIARYSANMHLVPASEAAAAALARVRAGELLRIDGWLLRIDGDEGWSWQSSMSREDSGRGACELVLVCAIRPR